MSVAGYSALRLGAGVSAARVVDVARRHRLRVAGGFCPSVGFAGGYIQGGGHGPLGSLYGLAVDQVLEWEVVTSRGQHVVASPAQHEDLYWAPAGSGGGGVVISVTVRAFPDDAVVGGASLSMQRRDQPDDDVLWDAFDAWQAGDGLRSAQRRPPGVARGPRDGPGAIAVEPHGRAGRRARSRPRNDRRGGARAGPAGRRGSRRGRHVSERGGPGAGRLAVAIRRIELGTACHGQAWSWDPNRGRLYKMPKAEGA